MTSSFGSKIYYDVLYKINDNVGGKMIININYLNNETGTQEARCMFFDSNKPKLFLEAIDERMIGSGIKYNTVRVSNQKIFIKDEQDLYCALIQVIQNNKGDRYPVVDIYLSYLCT